MWVWKSVCGKGGHWERPGLGAPEGEDGWGDVEGDHDAWPMSPRRKKKKKKVW